MTKLTKEEQQLQLEIRLKKRVAALEDEAQQLYDEMAWLQAQNVALQRVVEAAEDALGDIDACRGADPYIVGKDVGEPLRKALAALKE